jgi:hypothetical protein
LTPPNWAVLFFDKHPLIPGWDSKTRVRIPQGCMWGFGIKHSNAVVCDWINMHCLSVHLRAPQNIKKCDLCTSNGFCHLQCFSSVCFRLSSFHIEIVYHSRKKVILFPEQSLVLWTGLWPAGWQDRFVKILLHSNPFFVKINTYLLTLNKVALGSFCNFPKTAQSKKSPNRRKFAQFGVNIMTTIFGDFR